MSNYENSPGPCDLCYAKIQLKMSSKICSSSKLFCLLALNISLQILSACPIIQHSLTKVLHLFLSACVTNCQVLPKESDRTYMIYHPSTTGHSTLPWQCLWYVCSTVL